MVFPLDRSPDGQFLAVSSYDGYCSVLAFDKGELGTAVPADKARADTETDIRLLCRREGWGVGFFEAA